MTFGFKRVEILSAQVNGATLLVLGAADRLRGRPPPDRAARRRRRRRCWSSRSSASPSTSLATWTLAKANRALDEHRGRLPAHPHRPRTRSSPRRSPARSSCSTGFARADAHRLADRRRDHAAGRLRAAAAPRAASSSRPRPRDVDVDEIGRARWRNPRVVTRCTTCTSGRSAPASRPSRRTSCVDRERRLPRGPPRRSSDCSSSASSIEHTTLQVDHRSAGELLQVAGASGSPADRVRPQGHTFLFADIAASPR